MKNIILIQGNIKELIDKEVENIKTLLKIDDININKINYDNNLMDIIEDANMPSLFGGVKLIIVDGFILSTIEKSISIIENYLNNPNPNTYLIFITEEDKLDTRKKIVKLFNEKAQVYECGKVDNQITYNYIQEYINKNSFEIDKNTINTIIEYLGNDISNIKNEIDKIISSKKNNIITEEDILSIKQNNIDTNIFDLVDAICNKDLEKSIKLYRRYIDENTDIIKIIPFLSSKYRLIYQTKKLYSKGNNKYDISKILKVHSYPISLAINTSYKYTEKELLKILSDLYYIDLNFKKGKINLISEIELFILKNSKYE